MIRPDCQSPIYGTCRVLSYVQIKGQRNAVHKEESNMRGYFTANGYYGLVNGRYLLFASESEYYEMMGGEDDAA